MKKNEYELLYIINPVLEEDKFKEVVETATKILESNDCEVIDLDEWGARPLAYDIDGKHTGYYVNIYFSGPGEAIEKIERAFRLNDDILRYLTIKYDAKMKRHRELVKKGEKPTIFEEVEETNEDEG